MIRKRRCLRYMKKKMWMLKKTRKGRWMKNMRKECKQATVTRMNGLKQFLSSQSPPMIIYVDRELAAVVLWVSLRDFLQLVGVDDPKQDHGEATKCMAMVLFSCSWLTVWVLSINHSHYHYLLSLKLPKHCHWIVFSALNVIIVKSSIPQLGKRWLFGLGRVHGRAVLEQPRLITWFSIHFRLYFPQQS